LGSLKKVNALLLPVELVDRNHALNSVPCPAPFKTGFGGVVDALHSDTKSEMVFRFQPTVDPNRVSVLYILFAPRFDGAVNTKSYDAEIGL